MAGFEQHKTSIENFKMKNSGRVGVEKLLVPPVKIQ
jgi:hypothetical protein